MAEGHGGYRRPSNPAPVSGPGKHSRRTDGRPEVHDLPNSKYGEAQDFREIQSGAPMGNPSTSAAAAASGAAAPAAPPIPLGAASTMPGQPVTAGADAGIGPGMDALGLNMPSSEKEDLAQRYGPYLPLLVRKSEDPMSSQEFRDQVRYLVSVIG
ncbi:MAG TPA: hypothetical protein VIS29_02745 [Streptomyces sp.]